MASKTDIDQVESPVVPIISDIQKLEESIAGRMERGKTLIDKEKDEVKKGQMQLWWNFLQNWSLKLEAARKILDQTAVLITQDGGSFLVVPEIDERTRDLIQRAEELGGQVVSVERQPRQEVLL